MPETLKFRKKSTVKSFFSSIAREMLVRENIPARELRPTEQQQSSAATSDTVEKFSTYPTLPSFDPWDINHLQSLFAFSQGKLTIQAQYEQIQKNDCYKNS